MANQTLEAGANSPQVIGGEAANLPLVSVIMPVFNGAAYLRTAIESVLRRSYKNLELVIADDGSTDGSRTIVSEYLFDHRLVFLENEINLGVAATRNRAIAASSGNLITFLDQDDVWLERKLELQVAAIKSHPEVGLLHAEYARIDSQGELFPAARKLPPERFVNPTAPVEVRDVFAEIFVSNDIQPLTTMIRREVLNELGGFEPTLRGTDDYELWLRIALHYPVAHLRTIVGYWRAHPEQQSNGGYDQLVMRLRAIDLLLTRFPHAKQRVAGRAFRRRLGSMCRGIADENRFKRRNYRLARDMYARAWRYTPYRIPLLVRYAYCALPQPVRRFVRGIKRTLRPSPT